MLVGHIRGGLGIVTILGCMFFASMIGSGPGTVAAMGRIMIPPMTMITAMTITMRPHPPRRWWRRSGRTRISGPMLRRSTGALMAAR